MLSQYSDVTDTRSICVVISSVKIDESLHFAYLIYNFPTRFTINVNSAIVFV